MAGYYEKRGTDKNGNTRYRFVVELPPNFKGERNRATKTVALSSDRKADKELALFVAECEAGKFNYSGKVRLSDFCDKWFTEYASTKAKRSTLTGYKSIMENNIKPLLGSNPLDKITTLHVQEWINYLKDEKKLSPKTLRNCHSLLHDMLETAIKWGFISANPCVYTNLPPKDKKEISFYTKEEVMILIDKVLALDDTKLSFKASVMLALFSGLRMGEIAGLTWDNISFDNNTVEVEKERIYSPLYGTYEDDPKSEKSKRTLAIPDFCITLLRQLRQQQRERKLLLGAKWQGDNNFVFLTDFGKPIMPATTSDRFRKFVKEEGLKHVTLHGLRHTHASILAHLNINIVQASKRLGHSQIGTTQNIYTHLFEDVDREAANRLEKMFSSVTRSV